MNRVIQGSGGGGCFHEDTLVTTPIGKIRIKDLKVGDVIFSFDENGIIHESIVEKTFIHENDEIYKIRFWGGELLITLNHWVLNQYNAFAEIGTLTQDDCLVDDMGHLRPILSFEYFGSFPVYNLTVSDNHTFIADGIRVHNGGKGTRRLVAGSGGGGGDKGGGGTARSPVEAADSLRSKQYARVIDVICEGEIEGLVDGNKSVYLDNTPLQNTDLTYNFGGVTVNSRNGTQAQTYIPGFSDIEAENVVGVEVKATTPVVRTITNSNVNYARVTISIPRLTQQDTTTGDLNGASVVYTIDLQSNGGGYVTVATETVTGKTTTKYQRSTMIPLTGSSPWDVRVTRVTADSTSSSLINGTWWESYTEIIDTKLSYPNTALVGIQIDSSQFSNIPQRSYDVKLLKVKIPSNYNPITRVYTGVWDGTFSVAWTDNPAWCFYDLVTNTRYGLGNYISESYVDKWTLYTIGQYCDELVSDGFGGTEPRFTCNMYLQSREEAFKVLANMASIFRGMIYWGSVSSTAYGITAVQDKPGDIFTQFTNADVIDGSFNYAGSAAKTRHTVALVSWNDPNDGYKQKVEYVEDFDGIASLGVNETEIVAIGCTSRGQAHRLGRWLLYTERLETETVTFKTALKGTQIAPGVLIHTLDQHRAGVRHGGRIVSSTASAITIDNPITISNGVTYTVNVVLPDGTLVEKTITNAAGTHTTLTLSTSFTTQPLDYAIWVVTASNLSPETWRVVSVKEESKAVYTISAIEHNTSKYAAVEQNLDLQIPPTSYINANTQDPVTNIVVTDTLYTLTPDTTGIKIHIAWTAPSGARDYIVKYRVGNENYVEGVTASTDFDILDAVEGTYTISVVARNSLGILSSAVSTSKIIATKSEPPVDITNFSISVLGNNSYLSWDTASDLDLSYYRIKFSPALTGVTWGSSSDLIPKVSKPTTSAMVPTLIGTYLIKAVDYYGNESVNAALVVTNVASVEGLNAVATLTENPTFSGVKTSCEVVGTALQLSSVDTIADWVTLDSVVSMYYGVNGISTSGSYTFNNSLDLGASYTSRLTSNVRSVGSNIANTLNSWVTLDSVVSLSGTDPSQWGVNLYVRTTPDNPAGTPTWSSWMPFVIGDYTARAFEFKIDLLSYATNVTPSIDILEVTIDMPDRVSGAEDVVCPATGLTITYSPAFKAIPSTAISAQGLQTGDYYVISSKTAAGFNIQFFDSTNTGIQRTFDWISKGYGYAV